MHLKGNDNGVRRVNHQWFLSSVLWWKSVIAKLDITEVSRSGNWVNMAQSEVEDLVVHLEGSLEISSMEHGVKLIGAVLANQQLNKWGVKNILRNSWREYGEAQINWVKENTYVIIVRDEEMVERILDQAPWVVMKQNLSVKRWPNELACFGGRTNGNGAILGSDERNPLVFVYEGKSKKVGR